MNNPSSLEAHLGNAPGAVLAWRQRATPWVAHWRVYVHDSMQILLLNSAYLNLKHRATRRRAHVALEFMHRRT